MFLVFERIKDGVLILRLFELWSIVKGVSLPFKISVIRQTFRRYMTIIRSTCCHVLKIPRVHCIFQVSLMVTIGLMLLQMDTYIDVLWSRATLRIEKRGIPECSRFYYNSS